MSLGLFIGRLNPPHIGHIGIIKRALTENEKVLILLGTPFIYDKDNPFDFEERKKLLQTIFKDNKKLSILELKDQNTDLYWVEEIKNILENSFDDFSKIKFYLGDFGNDSSYRAIKQYDDKLKNYDIEYILNSRQDSFITHNGKKYSVSATNLREALKNDNYDLAKKFCNIEFFDLIKDNYRLKKNKVNSNN